MTAAFAGGWAGMGVIEDLNRGVVDRFLVSPVQRQALISGRLVQLAIVSVIQSLIVIAASNFVLLPLTFLSSAFMQRDLIPGWVQSVARYNPVEWTIQAGREALTASPDWGLVLSRAGLLAALCATCTWLATRAFRSYQRSV